MVTVLVAIDTVYKQMVAIPLEKEGNSDPSASRSLAAFARYVGHPKVIIQGDSEHALIRHMRVADSRNTTNLTCERQRLKWSSRESSTIRWGMARTLRLDLLSRTNIAMGGDLPITSWMVRHAGLLSHFQTGYHVCFLLLNGSCGKIRRSSRRS